MTTDLRVEALAPSRCDDYEKFVASRPGGLVTYSLAYRAFLEDYLGLKSEYLLAWDGRSVRGILPWMTRDGAYGRVANSLPLFGSHGGVLADDDAAFEILLDAGRERIASEDVAAATIIGNPYEARHDARLDHDVTDARISQVTPIRHEEDHENRLMASFHHKTRNMIRKAARQGMEVVSTFDDLEFLAATHRDHIEGVGGIAKDERYFQAITRHFPLGRTSRMYAAMVQGRPVAALLVLYYNGFVEYLTPVIRREFRARQPMSLLIFRAMVDASIAGFRLWNWGGTWLTQEGLHRFKKRWGSIDTPYTYHITVHNPDLRRLSREELRAAYPHFFVLPYPCLESSAASRGAELARDG